MTLFTQLKQITEALELLAPFQFAQGDAISRVCPESKQKLNTSGAWVVSQDVKSAHKARRLADSLNQALALLPSLISVIEEMEREWQDISSAPKDGTPILARFDGRIFQVWWSNILSDWAGTSRRGPTHWMPLPHPPTEKDSQ